MDQHTGHETYTAIREVLDARGRSKHAWHGTVRCIWDGEIAACAHAHKTRSAASECAETLAR